MYSVSYGNDLLFVPGAPDFCLLDPKLSLASNGAGKLTCVIRNDHPHYDELSVLENKVTVKDDGKTIWVGRIIDMERDFYNDVELTIEGYLAVLNDSTQRPHEFTGTPEGLFRYLIAEHNRQVGDGQQIVAGNVTVTDPNNYIARSWDAADTTWNVLKKHLLDTLGGYLILRYEEDIVVDWLAEIPTHSTQHVEFGENLMDLSVLIDASETCTACIPYGAEVKIVEYKQTEDDAEWSEGKYYTYNSDTGEFSVVSAEEEFNAALADGVVYEVESTTDTGKRLTIEEVNNGADYIVNNELAQAYGIIYAKTDAVTWDDITRPDNLLRKAQDYLATDGVTLKRAVDISFLDLSRLGYDAGKVRINQKVYVHSEPHGISASYLVAEMDIPLDAPEDMVIKLGESGKGFVAYQQDSNRKQELATDAQQSEIKYKTEAQKDYTDSLVKTATAQILSTSEKIVLGILAGYTKTEELEQYKQEIENTLTATKEGFEFSFKQFEETVDGIDAKITAQEEYVRISDGVIYIGKSGSAITTAYTNDSLQFLYNGVTVAIFANDTLEVRSVSVETQLRIGSQWALRKGAYQQGVGYNLNDMWIGG